MKVPLHFINAEICPGVKLSSGIVSHVMNDMDIALSASRPAEFIEVDLGQSGDRPFHPRIRPQAAQGRRSRRARPCC